MIKKMDIKERPYYLLDHSSSIESAERALSKMLSNFESYHLDPGYMRKRHFESVEPGLGLSWRMPSIT